MTRPERAQIVNELGKKQTLPSDKGQFESMGLGVETVFLGLGPEPERLQEWFPSVQAPLYVECPGFEEQMGPDWKARIPEGFWSMPAEAFTPEFARTARVIRYRPGLKAFPTFWGPLAARLAKAHWKECGVERHVWLPTTERDLLGSELAIAFSEEGYTAFSPDPFKAANEPGTYLPDLLQTATPELFFSVNFKGLDPFGLGFNLLREAGTRVAVWLVDNPFSLLTSVKSGYWKEVDLFVTDSSFILPLKELGAQSVHYLPLAACPQLFQKDGELPGFATGIENRLVFVGRSQFPDKDKYYAGLKLDSAHWDEARQMLEDGKRPDFHWWQEQTGVHRLWPGNEVRLPGFGAEESGRAWRSMCLKTAPDLTVFGDDGWKEILGPEADVRPVVDYYATLPAIYRQAGMCLNMTSPQLPAGLTQRHFDVWCAGGVLLTDDTPGLDLFPNDLARPITFASADDIVVKYDELKSNDQFRKELRAAWEALILLEHTYENRVKLVLEGVGLE
ncbi:glycosyltransferase family protein [Salidesulfovibrio onnuriiensis]|uniref:glycosyltransferase family protein n=1 Tax=Salidesulfovibrio onnuriiensis TaxID=2583823 RepID=UPI0011C70AF8|nr:DUF3880 domain-containing protein [Salidesulfovibrio onnuriiensis]